MLTRLADRDRLAKRVARPDPDAEFQLVVQPLGRTEARHRLIRPLALSVRSADRRTRGYDRGGAAVIADWHELVIRQQRVVGAEQLADVGCVVNADVEIG